MFQFELLFFTEILSCVLIVVFIHKMNQMKNKVEHVVQEVERYIAFITEEVDELEDEKETSSNQLFHTKPKETASKEELEKVQTHLIQTVLQEYFP